ncbi:uncharacterized protein LOC130137587 [Syzygium oleosum]|uniref:uncharacterized protein LOC130137587 n=1 Tax=Syzygium oleosum TaxID=219896 RepID=UPI0024BADC55|nr:uncharacterized protein LOC130137587 [Syzygium oleosum]
MGKLNKEAEDQKKVFKHDSHHHPVVLTKIHNTIQTFCSGCRINILPGEDYFACMPCHFFLHKRCFELPSSTTHDSHPHLLTLKFKTPYEGEEGFRCDLCAQPGTNQWLYCCQQCHYDVHLRCAKPQTGPNFQASCRSRSLANVKPAPLVNATTFDTQSANPPCGVRENFHDFHPGKTSMANQPVLVSQNAMTMTANRVPLNTTTPPIITSQYGQRAAYLGQSGNYSRGFQASRYFFSPTTAPSTIEPILMSPDGTTGFTTRGPLNNGTNPAMVVPQSRPSLAYSNNGVLYLNAAQGINNQMIYLRPNGGGAPMAAVVPQNQGLGYGNPVFYGAHNGMMGGMKEMAITGLASGFGGAFGEELFPGVTGMRGGDDDGEGSMGLEGSEILNSDFGEYF